MHQVKQDRAAEQSPQQEAAALLAAAGAGDRRAFARLYQLTCGKLYGVSLRLLHRTDLAEEALQEAFVNIWRHAADYQAERGAPLTWMAAIVRHRALDILRRERRGSAHEDLSAVENMPDSAPDPMMQTLLSAEARAIRNCLGALEERPQQCIILAFFHGYTHEELAARLGVPVGTVKSWIRRGLQRVKRCLES